MNACVRGAVEDARRTDRTGPRAGHRPRVEQREQELRIVGLELGELVELAHLVADDDAESHSGCRKRAQEPLFGRADRAAEQHEQVDVGVQAEVPPAVAAEREHGHRSLGDLGLREQLPQQRVDAVGIALESRAAARAPGDVGPQLVARGGDRRREIPASGASLGYGRFTHALRLAGPWLSLSN